MCSKLRVFAVLGVMFFLNGCQKPKPIINEYEELVGVWEYLGHEVYFFVGSAGDLVHTIQSNEFVENDLRLSIFSDGRLFIEINDSIIYQGKIMNIGLSFGTTTYMPGVSLRSTCFNMDPPIGQVKQICAMLQDGNLRTRQYPFAVSGAYTNQIFFKRSDS